MITAYPARQKKPWLLRCWHIRPGIVSPEMCLLPQARTNRWCWEKFRMFNHGFLCRPCGAHTSLYSHPPLTGWARLFRAFARSCGACLSSLESMLSSHKPLFYACKVKPATLKLLFSSLFLCLAFSGCAKHPDANTLVMIIESSPTNLDP